MYLQVKKINNDCPILQSGDIKFLTRLLPSGFRIENGIKAGMVGQGKIDERNFREILRLSTVPSHLHNSSWTDG